MITKHSDSGGLCSSFFATTTTRTTSSRSSTATAISSTRCRCTIIIVVVVVVRVDDRSDIILRHPLRRAVRCSSSGSG